MQSAADRKIFRVRDVEEKLGISRMHIQRSVDEGKLIKVTRKIYSPAEYSFSETQTLLEAAVEYVKKNPFF